MKKELCIAIIQERPVHLDLSRTMEKTIAYIHQAAKQDAKLIVFGETWLTGYPAWIDYCPDIAMWGYEPMKEIYCRMRSNSIQIPGTETSLLAELSKKYGITLCIGANERVDSGPGNGTIYNTVLIFNESGLLANHHRKLMPTFSEKLLYGQGDGKGLTSVQTAFGRIGSLICWEHWMPLARHVLHCAGEHIHVALWPSVHEIHQLASRHYAFEGRCFVVAVGQIMKVSDVPANLSLPDNLRQDPEKNLLAGGSCIISPAAQYELEPQFNTTGMILHTIKDMDLIYKERMTLDTSGHYDRPDVFRVEVRKE